MHRSEEDLEGKGPGRFGISPAYSRLYRDYNSYLRGLFGCRVQKITLDAGRTCPNRDGSLGYGGCIYCNERGSGTGAAGNGASITEQIVRGKLYLGRRYKAKKFLAYFQSYTNTYGPLHQLEQIFGEALVDPDIVGLSIGTRPDCVPDAVLDSLARLAENRFIGLEFGLQSAHDSTLSRIGRGHDVQTFVNALVRARARNLPVCVHVILGLPGETHGDMLHTARFLAAQDIQAVKIHLLYVVRGTILHQWYRDRRYTCLSREQFAATVGDFLALLPASVVIQRLTGDPHPAELVAPLWALEKQRNLEAIHSYMCKNNLYQGKALENQDTD